MSRTSTRRRTLQLLGGLVALGLSGAAGAATDPKASAGSPPPTATAGSTAARPASPYRLTSRVQGRAETYYSGAWGVDKLKVTATSSGNLLRFSYRVSDPARAVALGDKKNTPYLLGQRSRALLKVPVMDKVGQLRQAAPPKAGQEYWMVFSNKGSLIKPGDKVTVMIGTFRAEGLVVEGS